MWTRRILCVWLPYWATTRLRHAQPAPPDSKRATIEAVRGQRRLASVCAAAEAAGLYPGQGLAQARALCPDLLVADATPAEDAVALAALAHWATRYTPLAAAAAPDTLWLDIGGCAHLAGGEAALAADLARRLARWDLAARWAIAGTPGAAHAAARHAPGSLIAPGAETTALAALPIEALRLDPAAVAALRRLGLKTIAALARLPRAELAARFGALPGLRLDQAFGHQGEPILWPVPPPDWSEQRRLPEPIQTTQSCLAVLDDLCRRLCARLADRRQGGRQFVAGFQRLDGSVHEIAVATALPVHDSAYLLHLLAERLDGMDPGFGIERVALSAPSLAAAPPSQGDLGGGQDGAQAGQRLARLVDTLANRLSPARLFRLAPRDSHLPEAAQQPVPPLPPQPIPAWHTDPAAPRPIRLLRYPEPIKVMALMPDHPPARFQWRGAMHGVQAATGPERIAEEWWTAEPGGSRDYYHVEDDHGSRFWLYRSEGAWFLHGLFG